jgi:hypothetical protein
MEALYDYEKLTPRANEGSVQNNCGKKALLQMLRSASTTPGLPFASHRMKGVTLPTLLVFFSKSQGTQVALLSQ